MGRRLHASPSVLLAVAIVVEKEPWISLDRLEKRK
jgi:hypothetical protein